MGLPVMSLLLDDETGTLIIFLTKKFAQGKEVRKVINQWIPFPMSIEILKNILFKRPPSSAWNCHQNDTHRWNDVCIYQKNRIHWSGKNAKSLLLTISDWNLTFHYLKFEPQVKVDMLYLKIPSHFQPLKNFPQKPSYKTP